MAPRSGFATIRQFMRREHRHELRSDGLIAGIGAAFDWSRSNVRTIGWGAAAVIGLSVLVGALLVTRGDRRDALRAELTTLTADLQGVDSEGSDARDACGSALPRLLEIGEAEGGSTEGRTARYFAGICQRRAGDHAAAVASFDSVRGRSGLLSDLATFGLAGARRDAGAVEEAADAYRGLLGSDSGLPVDAVLFELATLEEERGRRGEAVILYERIANEYSDSRYRQIADTRVARLGERESPDAAPGNPAR